MKERRIRIDQSLSHLVYLFTSLIEKSKSCPDLPYTINVLLDGTNPILIMSQVDIDTASGSRSGTVSRALMISPSTAPNPKLQLRVNTSIDNPAHYLDPPPRYQSHIETGVRTAPLFLQPPPRRAFSQDVDAMTATKNPAVTAINVSRPIQTSMIPPATPSTPPFTGPHPRPPPRANGATHGRKISEKFKSIFTHSRKTSEPFDMISTQPLVTGMMTGPARRISHPRNGSAPGDGGGVGHLEGGGIGVRGGRGDDRIMRWIHETAVEGERNPPRPHRSPNTASFIVSADNRSFEPGFPRYDPSSTTMLALHSNCKASGSGSEQMTDENDIVEPITAALYPLGKGLLGTTRRRAHLDDALPGIHRIEISHFSPTTPATATHTRADHLDVTEEQAESASSSSSSGGESSFDAMWYMTPHY